MSVAGLSWTAGQPIRLSTEEAGKNLFVGCIVLFFTQHAQFFEITGGDYARWQGDDRDAEQRRKHGYDTADVGYGAQVAVTDGGQGDGRPIEGVEKGTESLFSRCRVDMRLGVEHDQGCQKDIEQRQHQHRQKDLALLVENPHEHFDPVRIAQHLQNTYDSQQAGQTQQFESAVEQVQSGEDRQQIDDSHRSERVDQIRCPAFFQLDRRSVPSGRVVDDESCYRDDFRDPENGIGARKHQRNNADKDAGKHPNIINAARSVMFCVLVDNGVYLGFKHMRSLGEWGCITFRCSILCWLIINSL